SSTKHLKELADDANALDFETQCLRKPRAIRVAFIPIFGDGHWSLLVYRSEKNKLPEFLHFNSYLNSTRAHHTQCARTALINLLYVFRENDPDMTISKESYKLVVKNCPQQNNGNDCGVFVCMYAYILSSRLAKSEKERSSSIHNFVRRLSNMSVTPPVEGSDQLSFSEKNRHKDRKHSVDHMWKVKDRDGLPPDDMREYIQKVIYHASASRAPSASL
ncbi:hypothetical protein IWW45_004216, partial [Coemansia sp. RSA 485]